VVTVNGAKVGNKLPSKECSTLGEDFLRNVQKRKIFFTWDRNSHAVTVHITIHPYIRTFMHTHKNKWVSFIYIYIMYILLDIYSCLYKAIPTRLVQCKRYLGYALRIAFVLAFTAEG